ncbi:Oidioi.mRNA.OKI2018_I69.PAR.g9925.t1.cds [Oikopleura dioica]|uniref:Oidioi.mRNA.OKI2018_I69.PAR.g9925.t1.cds n=1 Tax=Oikopleura dioica TaxID=34765 RepID=A0ABN7RMX5_OIKDI|nr:Oidioi.mRNA.OKI2018_I69.PAR.g9925.t1.cds [Oikopleura dioica]
MDKHDGGGDQHQHISPSNSKSFWRPEQMVTLEEIRPPSNDSNDGDGSQNDDAGSQSLNTEQALQKLNQMLRKNSEDVNYSGNNEYQSSSSSSSGKFNDWGSSRQAYPKNFNPATAHFTEDELKPTPISRKAQKKLVKPEDKDEKYWQKRKKNNAAAKRSREARRSRENQIAMRAGFLEADNAALKEELLNVKEELQTLKEKLLVVQMRAATEGKLLND